MPGSTTLAAGPAATADTWTHPAVEVYQLADDQRGIRAAEPIPADTVIGFYGGMPVRYPRGPDGRIADPDAAKHAVQVFMDDNFVYALTSPPGVPLSGVCFINHSCKPNVRIVNQLVMVTMRAIAEGEELKADYRSWDLVGYGELCSCTTSSRCEI